MCALLPFGSPPGLSPTALDASYLKLDQATPQTVSGGAPIFDDGITLSAGVVYPDLVVNGTFDTNTDWTKGTGWSISGGSANHSTNGIGNLSQSITIIPGQTYRVTYRVLNYTSGTVTPTLGGVELTPRTAAGTYMEVILAVDNTGIYFATDNTARLSLDSVTIYLDKYGLIFNTAGNPIINICDNILLGEGAGNRVMTPGTRNFAAGNIALAENISGNYNIALGYQSLSSNISGSGNTAFGSNSLIRVLGSNNIGIGNYAGAYETGSDSFYLDNRDRTDTAGDKAKALLYGTFADDPANQTLKVNAALTATSVSGNNVTSGADPGHTHTAYESKSQVHILQGTMDLTSAFQVSPNVWILDLHADRFPYGINISKIYVDCSVADPTTELDADLKYCDAVAGGAFPGANAATIKAIDTTTGNFADAAVNTTIATGKSIYIALNADPTDASTVWHTRIHYTILTS